MHLTLPTNSLMQTKNFTFGVATASFQIEGGVEDRLPCIWDTFCAKKGTIRDNSNGDNACEHYQLWQQDVDLIASLAVDAYRFSISWPRVITKEGKLNQVGVDFYLNLLDALNDKGIKPFVTLYHWDLPQHLEDEGGWLNRQTAYRYCEYVDLITQALGDRVYSYATFNEPFCSAYLGYELGIHAPGLASKAYGKKAAHHILLAHGLAMPIINKNSPDSENGIVLNFSTAYPASSAEADVTAAKLADDHFNQWYIKPLMDGAYPDLIDQLPAEERPEILDGDMEVISHAIDFIGVNFYTRAIYKADDEQGFIEVKPDNAEFTDMGWEVYPQGFTQLLTSLNDTYTLPAVYITENGAAMPNDEVINGQVSDPRRVAYYQQHLAAVDQAINQGVNIVGYFAWSLMDNFEWAEGYLKRFGIVHVDYQTQKRTIKASGYAYRNLLQSRKLQGVA